MVEVEGVVSHRVAQIDLDPRVQGDMVADLIGAVGE